MAYREYQFRPPTDADTPPIQRFLNVLLKSLGKTSVPVPVPVPMKPSPRRTPRPDAETDNA